MTKTIMIGDIPVEMQVTGLTPLLYKHIFRRDYFRDVTDSDIPDRIEIFTRMAFVMAKQAEGANPAKLNEESFFEWMNQFGALDVPNATDEIALFFSGAEEQTVNPKGEEEQ